MLALIRDHGACDLELQQAAHLRCLPRKAGLWVLANNSNAVGDAGFDEGHGGTERLVPKSELLGTMRRQIPMAPYR